MSVGDGAGTQATNVSALVEALDRRARQSGTEGATNVLRGMVATITEVLGGLEQRLDRIEHGIADGGAAEANSIGSSLAGLHDRIGRLEEAFVQAVESSTEGSDAMIGEIRAAIEAASPAPAPPPAPAGAPPELDGRLAEVVDRLRAIEQSVATAAETAQADRAHPADDGQVLAGVAHLADLVRSLEARVERFDRSLDADPTARVMQESLTAIQVELSRLSGRLADVQPRDDQALVAIRELRDAWESGYDRLDRAVGAVRAAVEAVPADGSGSAAATADDLRELQAAIERLARNDSAGRLVGLIEERLSTALDAMVARAESAVEASRSGRTAVEAGVARVQELADSVDGLTAAVESLGARVERETVTAIDGVGGRILDRIRMIADEQSRDDDGRVAGTAAIGEALRREAELLTQRIAALAKSVEDMRGLLDDHVRSTENTFGRRAGEVGRRLAVDFGLRPRREEDAEAIRELGRGG